MKAQWYYNFKMAQISEQTSSSVNMDGSRSSGAALLNSAMSGICDVCVDVLKGNRWLVSGVNC